MTKYEVLALVGAGPVRLGMTPAEVEAVMGTPKVVAKGLDKHPVHTFLRSTIQVFYCAKTGLVEYIELSRNANFEVWYRDISVFETEATQLVSLISAITLPDETHPEFGYSYVFPEIEFSLWRPVMPESDSDEDGRFFSTVGIGVRGYYSKP
jgi:hypothetical protein